MQPFRVHILGCGSALPTAHHHPSSQVVEIRGKYFMIDCGEGTQAQVRRSHINFSKLQAVFISHIHGDHVFGLMGMISTFGLQGRTAPLHVYAPEGYEALFHAEMQMFCSTIDYEVIFHPVDTSVRQVIFEDRSLTVETIPLKHRMPCAGFLFKEKQGERHINPKALEFYNVPRSQINNLRAGLDWTSLEGEVIPNDKLTTPPDPVRSYAYCSDTRYMQSLGKDLSGVTMLYHEATYGEDMKDNAVKYMHSTAREAALTAKTAGAGKLLLGHYSQRYSDEKPLLNEAKQVFENTLLSNEGMTIDVL
ncbi:MAG: ribonuclease Z [Prevotella sp.]|nr:ribonuclease Z [Prevotella sp.]